MPEAKKRLITAEDLYQFNQISGMRISPDGQSVIYAVHRVDAKTEKKYSNLWIAAADEKEPSRASSPMEIRTTAARAGHRDGQQIAFLSNRG